MGIMQGLMAGANFGTGFYQGQDQALAFKMNQLAYANAQLKQEQMAQSMRQQQALSDYAIATSNFSITDPLTGRPLGGANPLPTSSPEGSGPTNTPTDPSSSPTTPAPTDPLDADIARMDTLANAAASVGDLDRYTQLSTNATNLRLAKSNMAEHSAAAQLAEAKRQTLNYQQVSSIFSDLDPNSPTFTQDFKARQLQAEALPTTSEEERANLAKMQPSAGALRAIVQGGMSASQQAAARHQQLTMQETQRHNRAIEEIDRSRLHQQTIHDQQLEKDKQLGNKVGKIVPSPTKEDIAVAANVIGPIIFPDGNIDTSNPDYSRALSTLASRAKAYQQQHRTVPYSTAVATVAQQAKTIGEFTPTTAVKPGIFGTSLGAEQVPGPEKFKAKGDAPDSALPLPQNPKKPNSYIPGKYYNVPGHGPMMWVVRPDGTSGFDPNS